MFGIKAVKWYSTGKTLMKRLTFIELITGAARTAHVEKHGVS